MSDLTDIDALAADYVLGQLDPAERQAVSARLTREPALASAVASWERRLSPLNELTPSVAPSDHLLAAIEARINAIEPAGAVGASAEVIDLTARLRRWRVAAGLTGALAASLVMFTALREARQPPTMVAVLQKDSASPAFVLTVDPGSKSFNVRTVSAEPQPDRSYELWLVSDKLPAPKSLGLVGQGTSDAPRSLAAYDPALVSNATFAVSVEPKGGSPTGKPTGAVVYAGKLISATP
jgi:anti-sigma-K factor RskA